MKKRRLWTLAALLGWGLAAMDFQAGQVLAPEQSSITFVGKQIGAPAQGKFQTFSVDATLDPAALDQSRVKVVIDMNSVALPASDFTTEVKRKRWFDTAAFPEAIFESKQLRKLDGGGYQADGVLILKGVSKPISVPLTLKTEGLDLAAEGQFEIKRLDFNVGDGQWADTDTVANEVQIKFKLRLKPRP